MEAKMKLRFWWRIQYVGVWNVRTLNELKFLYKISILDLSVEKSNASTIHRLQFQEHKHRMGLFFAKKQQLLSEIFYELIEIQSPTQMSSIQKCQNEFRMICTNDFVFSKTYIAFVSRAYREHLEKVAKYIHSFRGSYTRVSYISFHRKGKRYIAGCKLISNSASRWQLLIQWNWLIWSTWSLNVRLLVWCFKMLLLWFTYIAINILFDFQEILIIKNIFVSLNFIILYRSENLSSTYFKSVFFLEKLSFQDVTGWENLLDIQEGIFFSDLIPSVSSNEISCCHRGGILGHIGSESL